MNGLVVYKNAPTVATAGGVTGVRESPGKKSEQKCKHRPSHRGKSIPD